MRKSASRAARTGEGTPGLPNVVALAELWADQFKHIATLGVAGAGGVLIALQAELLRMERRWWLALVMFVATAVLAMYGHIGVVDAASEGRAPGKRQRVIRGLALASLGAAGGAAIGTLRL
jgi:hypothetical protein